VDALWKLEMPTARRVHTWTLFLFLEDRLVAKKAFFTYQQQLDKLEKEKGLSMICFL